MGRHSNVDPIDIKTEKLSVADDASSYGGNDTGHDDDTPEVSVRVFCEPKELRN